jgi:Bacterial Ig domain
VEEDAAATNVSVLTNDTDIDGGPKTISSASDPAKGTVVVTGGGSGLTYQPDPNYCNDPPATNLDTFTYTLNGDSQGTVSMTVTCVNDNPVATDESFNGASRAIGNTSLVVNDPTDGAPDPNGPQKTVSGDILSNDTDVDGPGPLAVRANPTFELKNSFLESPGDGDNESAIFFDTLSAANITGRMAVSDTTIQNFEDVGLHVGNNSGTLTIDVTNVTFNNNSDTNGEEGIDVAAEGTANTTLNVGGSTTFTDLEGGAMNVISQQSGDVDMNINGTTTTGTGGPDNFPTPPAMTFSSEGSSSGMTFDITNNDILDSSGDGIFIGHEGVITGRMTGNDVSNIALGDGLRIDTDTAAPNTATILVDGNNFGNVAGNTGIGDDGIQVLHRDGTKTLNLTVTNNQIKNTDSEGIRYFTDDDVSGGGPGNNVRIANNQFGNNGVEDLSDSMVMISQDPGTDLCTHITGNTSVEGITLQQSLSAVLQITQASTAALAAVNGNATVTPSGTITFNGTCTTTPQPTNP